MILGSDQLYVVPVKAIDHVHVRRLRPGRGGGFAEMRLACRGGFGNRPIRHLHVAGHGDPHGLDTIAEEMADWLGRPCAFDDDIDM